MKGFECQDGHAVAHLDEQERTVIARVVADVGLLLGSEPFGLTSVSEQYVPQIEAIEEQLARWGDAAPEPEDPAVLRVFPNAAPTDREVADEFRRLTEPDLRDMKIARLRRIWDQLSGDDDAWVVPLDQALDTAAALTDIRLVMASRLDVMDDVDAQRLHQEVELAEHALATGATELLEFTPERVWLGMLYAALMWLQSTLVDCLEEPGETT